MSFKFNIFWAIESNHFGGRSDSTPMAPFISWMDRTWMASKWFGLGVGSSRLSETASKWFQVIILCFTFHRSLSTSEKQMITVCIGSGCVTHHINHHGMFHLCSIPGRRSEVATNGCVAPAAVCEMGKGSEAAQRSDPTGREICRWHKDIGIPKIA